jgi:hypothetical protein
VSSQGQSGDNLAERAGTLIVSFQRATNRMVDVRALRAQASGCARGVSLVARDFQERGNSTQLMEATIELPRWWEEERSMLYGRRLHAQRGKRVARRADTCRASSR